MGKRKGKSKRDLPKNFGDDTPKKADLISKFKPCPACKGAGREYTPTLGGLAYNEISCSKCGGRGVLTELTIYYKESNHENSEDF